MNNQKDLFALLVFLSLVSAISCAERFKDDIMMQKHHHEKNL